MKVMVVADIAPNSTRDVYDGLRAGLTQCGCDVVGYPTWAYACHMVEPYNEKDPSKLPPHISAMIWGAVGQMICGAITLNRPDAVIVVSGWVMPRLVVDAVKSLGVTTALYLTESPYQDEEQTAHESFNCYDVVFCNELGSMEWMRTHHDNVVYLPHSYNPEVHKPTPGEPQDYDVFMCGTGFTERRDLIAAADWGGARVRLVGFWPGDNSDLPAVVQDSTIPNAHLPAVYGAVPINLNIHRTTRTWMQGRPEEQHIDYAQSVGPRVLEVLASGGFLLTDHRAELDDMGLRDGEHLAVFRGADDLGAKARHYLQHGDERRRIAENGRAAVRGCTFSSRCESVILPELTKGPQHG